MEIAGDIPAAAGGDVHDLKSILSGKDRDFLVRSNGDKVKLTDMSNKVVGLYFSASWCGPCRQFTPKLVEAYEMLMSNNEAFEIVFISADTNEESFDEYFSEMPWLAIPFSDSTTRECLNQLFSVSGIPHLVLLDGTGKVYTKQGVMVVREYGLEAYPFTPEKIEQLKKAEEAAKEAQTLRSILVSPTHDFLISSNGDKVLVSELVGKNVLLYFSAHWCPPCRAFLPKLIETYHKIKKDDDAFEIVFISSDRDQSSFDDFFATMPWLAIPFGDARKDSLSRIFKVRGIPSLVTIGRTGKTVTTETRELVMLYGADAYPFTDERKREMESKLDELAKGWPQTLRHPKHEEHELVLARRRRFICDGCREAGKAYSFYCAECDFDLHPNCALEDQKKGEEVGEEGKDGKEGGYVCDGEVCYKA